jgi:hypothetical protein
MDILRTEWTSKSDEAPVVPGRGVQATNGTYAPERNRMTLWQFLTTGSALIFLTTAASFCSYDRTCVMWLY